MFLKEGMIDVISLMDSWNKTSSYKFIFKMMKSTSQDYLITKVRLNPPPACPGKIFPACTDFFPAKRLDQLSWFIFLISRNEYQKKLSDFYFGGLCHSTSSYYSHNKIVEKCTEKKHTRIFVVTNRVQYLVLK